MSAMKDSILNNCNACLIGARKTRFIQQHKQFKSTRGRSPSGCRIPHPAMQVAAGMRPYARISACGDPMAWKVRACSARMHARMRAPSFAHMPHNIRSGRCAYARNSAAICMPAAPGTGGCHAKTKKEPTLLPSQRCLEILIMIILHAPKQM